MMRCAYSLAKAVKHCLGIGGKSRFEGIDRERAMFPHHILKKKKKYFQNNINERKKF